MKTLLCTVVYILASVGLVAGQIYHIPTVSVPPDNSSCPPDSHMMDAIKTDVTNKLSNALTKHVMACGGFGWRQVAFMNMTDPDQNCPDVWRLYKQGCVRACGRQRSNTAIAVLLRCLPQALLK